MRTIGILILALLVPASTALADGAVAIGIPPSGVAKAGFAWGRNVNSPSVEAASNRALDNCRIAKDASPEARQMCGLFMSFNNQCVALALDPAAGTPGVGWAVAPQKETAERQALANCRKTAGAGRENACVISDTACDTTKR